ncbi:MAG TPA: hypothetical protein VE621_14255 [Bryobacteraceae bacterium]|nr:hypothetical protein [Bryobacteraceae bacterium]
MAFKFSFASLALLFTAGTVIAGPAKPATANGGNAAVDVTARAITSKEEVAKELGSNPDFTLVLVDVRVRPRDEKNKLRIDRDDFTLVSARDGQRSQPLDPSQIAGKGAVRITQTEGGAVATENRGGPVWGGIGGRPTRMGGNGGAIGNTAGGNTTVSAEADKNSPESPLLAKLKEKVLRNGETSDAVSGMLYFLFDGKPPRGKDLTLIYKGAGGGRLLLEFSEK